VTNSRLCECGCGRVTRIVNGAPNRYILGHSSRGHKNVGPWRAIIAAKARENRDAKHPMWLGDSVGYNALHTWVRTRKEMTGTCSECGESPQPVTYTRKSGQVITRRMTEWANISGEYRRDVDDYRELCKPCHIRFDRGRKAA